MADKIVVLKDGRGADRRTAGAGDRPQNTLSQVLSARRR